MAAIVVFAYFRSRDSQRQQVMEPKFENRYHESSTSSPSQDSNRHGSKEGVRDGCWQDLRRHLVQLDEKKKAEENCLLGINLTNINTNIISRPDHEYTSDPHNPQETDPSEGATTGMGLVPTTKAYTFTAPTPHSNPPLTPNSQFRGSLAYYRLHESRSSSESIFSKRSTFRNTEGSGQNHSNITRETSVSSKTSSIRLHRTASFRRRSVGDVMSG